MNDDFKARIHGCIAAMGHYAWKKSQKNCFGVTVSGSVNAKKYCIAKEIIIFSCQQYSVSVNGRINYKHPHLMGKLFLFSERRKKCVVPRKAI